MPLLILLRKKYLSIRGYYSSLKAEIVSGNKTMLKSVTTNETRFSFTMIQDSYNDYLHYNGRPNSCPRSYVYCKLKCRFHLTNFQIDENRTIIRLLVYTEKLTWNEASNKCKEIGGVLPYFIRRSQFDHFLAFHRLLEPWIVKVLEFIQIFIGLKFSWNEVGFHSHSSELHTQTQKL